MAVTPIRRQMSVVPAASAPVPMSAPPQPSQQDWVWDGANWVWNPSPCPPQPMPPGCCPPFPMPPPCPPPWWWSVAPCPPPVTTPPPSPSPPPPLTGPIVGVTDGSNAKPGEIGEFVSGSSIVNYAASVVTTTVISPLVVQPGDWDLWGYMLLSTAFIGAYFEQTIPVAAGMSAPIFGKSTGPVEGVAINAVPQRGNFAIPTLLSFTVLVDMTSIATAGTSQVVIYGRRVR